MAAVSEEQLLDPPSLSDPLGSLLLEQRQAHQEVAKTLSYTDQLQSLLAKHYPQYGLVTYERLIIDGQTGRMRAATEGDMAADNCDDPNARPHATSSRRYKCRVRLFEMSLEGREVFPTWMAAQEAVAKMGLDMLREFNRIILDRATDKKFGRILAPLVEQMKAQVANAVPQEPPYGISIPDGVVAVEKERTDRALAVQPQIMGDLLSSISQKMNSTSENFVRAEPTTAAASSPRISSDTEAPNATETNNNTADSTDPSSSRFNPISCLFEHYQKIRLDPTKTVEEPKFGFFTKNKLHGCIVQYMEKTFTAPASYQKQVDAKKAACRDACHHLYGDIVPLEAVEMAPIAKMTNSVAASLESSANAGIKEVVIVANTKELLNSSKEADDSLAPHPKPVNLPPLKNNQKYVSAINQLSQVQKCPAPSYTFTSGKSLSAFFVCTSDNPFTEMIQAAMQDRCAEEIEASMQKRFISAAFVGKMDAKEDCAARIFAHLRECGVIDEDGKAVESLRKISNAALRKRPSSMVPLRTPNPVATRPTLETALPKVPLPFLPPPPILFPPPPILPPSPMSMLDSAVSSPMNTPPQPVPPMQQQPKLQFPPQWPLPHMMMMPQGSLNLPSQPPPPINYHQQMQQHGNGQHNFPNYDSNGMVAAAMMQHQMMMAAAASAAASSTSNNPQAFAVPQMTPHHFPFPFMGSVHPLPPPLFGMMMPYAPPAMSVPMPSTFQGNTDNRNSQACQQPHTDQQRGPYMPPLPANFLDLMRQMHGNNQN